MQLQGNFKLLTTGTPIQNHLGELWSLFNFINPGLLGSNQQFAERFVYATSDAQARKKKNHLKQLIQPFILRRTKQQVLDDLPAKTEITLEVEMSEQEKALYEALRLQAVENLETKDDNGKSNKHIKILAEITKLRQACCHPKLAVKDSTLSSSKLAIFLQTINELRENNHRVLVFSQFTSYLHLVQGELDKRRIHYQYLDGATPLKERDKRVKAFQAGEGDLFLISLKAGGLGLNLTAADYVIHLDPWWNPAIEDQASDRAHRYGQTRPVTIYRLITKGTIEEKIVKLHHTKKELADTLLEGTDQGTKLSSEELLKILMEE
jgi:SNF2 family DNA or RNA helicase